MQGTPPSRSPPFGFRCHRRRRRRVASPSASRRRRKNFLSHSSLFPKNIAFYSRLAYAALKREWEGSEKGRERGERVCERGRERERRKKRESRSGENERKVSRTGSNLRITFRSFCSEFFSPKKSEKEVCFWVESGRRDNETSDTWLRQDVSSEQRV